MHSSELSARTPLVLTVPGLHGSGSNHWQTLWERDHDDTERVELGMWENPRRNVWVTKLDQAVRTADAPVILAAHSLGCLAVAWWAELSGQPWGWPVAGALLVAPPDVNRPDAADEIRAFGPSPKTILPFPSIVVGSEDDPYCSLQRTFDMAREWGSHFVNLGHCGHINADSGMGAWREGRMLIEWLAEMAEAPILHATTTGDIQAIVTADQVILP